MKKLKMTFRKGGKTDISGEGYAGNGCDELEKLGQRLGTVKNVEFTEEYYKDEQADNVEASW